MCRMVSLDTNFGDVIEVADIKKANIESIIRAAKYCAYIDAIILFGSAITDECREDSDIDVAIISNVRRSILFKDKSYREFKYNVFDADEKQSYDFLQFDSEDMIKQSKDFVCRDIRNNGRVIYRRQIAYV